jgi:hypothetical protein
MMIVAGDPLDFRTISEFRRRHLQALAGLFVQVLKLAGKAGLVKLGHVALDGTKVRANASRHKAMSYAHMKRVKRSCKSRSIAGWRPPRRLIGRKTSCTASGGAMSCRLGSRQAEAAGEYPPGQGGAGGRGQGGGRGREQGPGRGGRQTHGGRRQEEGQSACAGEDRARQQGTAQLHRPR